MHVPQCECCDQMVYAHERCVGIRGWFCGLVTTSDYQAVPPICRSEQKPVTLSPSAPSCPEFRAISDWALCQLGNVCSQICRPCVKHGPDSLRSAALVEFMRPGSAMSPASLTADLLLALTALSCGCAGPLALRSSRSRTGSTSHIGRHQPPRWRTLRRLRHPRRKPRRELRLRSRPPSSPPRWTRKPRRICARPWRPSTPGSSGLRSLERDSDSAQLRNAGAHGQNGPRAVLRAGVPAPHVQSSAASKAAQAPPRTTEPPPSTPEKITVADALKEPRATPLPLPPRSGPTGHKSTGQSNSGHASCERVGACGEGGGDCESQSLQKRLLPRRRNQQRPRN